MEKLLISFVLVHQSLLGCAVCDKFEAQDTIVTPEKEAIKINQGNIESSKIITQENRVLVMEWNFQEKKNVRACYLQSLKRDQDEF